MVYSKRRFILSFALCYFVLVFFSPFSIAITSLGEEKELILVRFVRLFNLRLFGFVSFLFFLVSGKGWACDCGFSGLFSFFFFMLLLSIQNNRYTNKDCILITTLKQNSDFKRMNICPGEATLIKIVLLLLKKENTLFRSIPLSKVPFSEVDPFSEGDWRAIMLTGQ